MYLYSTPNIVGCLLALLGLGLYFGGVIDAYWPGIVLGLYLAGVMGWPRSSLADMAEHAELKSEQLTEELCALVVQVSKGLPPEALKVLHAIEATLAELLPRLEELQGRGVISHEEAFTVHETVRRYLPDTLAGYLRLPKLFAQMQPMAGGKTASRVLVEQLEVLDASLRELAINAFSSDARTLVANGQFLQSKFSRGLTFQW